MIILKRNFYLFTAFLCCLCVHAYSQCTTPISSFPYNEGFEVTNGNWSPSSAIHWEWGQIISKPVITAAGSGNKCWVVGGFSGNSYNSGSSNLVSPCFDISSLTNPEISFKIFWETERKYDGASIEYSIDGGIVWQLLGSINSNNDCSGQNWFNYDPVNFLGGAGWSGNIQSTAGSCQGGGGSGGWLTAKHTLSSIAGSTGVRFRLVFAAGTTCNNFDGFAIDDVRISEALVSGADFTYTCGANNTVSFSSIAGPCSTGVTWNFDDPGSGVNNTSNAPDPTHVFSSVGNHAVTLTTTFSSGPAIIVAKNIVVISATAAIDSINCNGNNTGAVTVTVLPPGTYNYSWDTNPVQVTPVISSLSAGSYHVTISSATACSTVLPVLITEPAPLQLEVTGTNERCGGANGTLSATASGGISPYAYLWSNTSVASAINGLVAGVYSVSLTDAKGCTTDSTGLIINNVVTPVAVSLGPDTYICPGQSLVLNPGNFASYKWQDNSNAPTFAVDQTGTYAVTVTDANGCAGTATVKVTVDCPEIYFPAAFTPDNNSKNDAFGALGSLGAIRNYKLQIFGRWGGLLFSTTDPYKKWDGTYKGKPLPGDVYVWSVTYALGSFLPETRKGTVIIIR